MRGLVLANPHGDLLIEGAKTLIVKDGPLAKDLGREVVLIQGDIALGILKLKTREPINREEFDARKSDHRVSENERRRWWPTASRLYAFGFSVEERFQPPKRIFRDKAERTRVDEVVFKDEDYYAALKTMFSAEVDGASGEGLLLVHRLLHSFFARRKDGDRVVIEKRERSLTDIVERHSEVVGALSALGAAHDGPRDDLNSMSRPFEALASAGPAGKSKTEVRR